jgi:hypothetical protein
MKAKILFQISMGFDQTLKTMLEEESEYNYYDKTTHLYNYVFDISKLHKIINLVGVIDFKDKETEIRELIKLCPPIFEKVTKEQWKSLGKLIITKCPKIFIVSEFVKDNEGKPKEINHEIPIENVLMAWEVIKKQNLDVWVKTRTVAENICRLLGLQRFFRDSGTFDYEKFFGTRSDYFLYYYYPIVILRDFCKCINYHKSGKVMKISEMNIQEVFKNDN